MTLADIASGNTDTADVMFLVAFIVAVIGVVAALVPAGARFVSALLAAAVALVAFGFLLL